MPSQAQQLTRSYTGRLLVNVEITIRESPVVLQHTGESETTVQMEVDETPVPEPIRMRVHQADIRDLCFGARGIYKRYFKFCIFGIM